MLASKVLYGFRSEPPGTEPGSRVPGYVKILFLLLSVR